MFAVLAAVLAFAAVALGAVGSHVLEALVGGEPDAGARLAWWAKANHYHAMHAVALLVVGLAAPRVPGRALRVASWSFVAGVLLFSGSLYAMALTGERAVAWLTPIGGTSFLVGWGAAIVAFVRARPALR